MCFNQLWFLDSPQPGSLQIWHDKNSDVDPLQQRLRLRFLAEVRPENILDSQIEYVFDCKYLCFKNILDLTNMFLLG